MTEPVEKDVPGARVVAELRQHRRHVCPHLSQERIVGFRIDVADLPGRDAVQLRIACDPSGDAGIENPLVDIVGPRRRAGRERDVGQSGPGARTSDVLHRRSRLLASGKR